LEIRDFKQQVAELNDLKQQMRAALRELKAKDQLVAIHRRPQYAKQFFAGLDHKIEREQPYIRTFGAAMPLFLILVEFLGVGCAADRKAKICFNLIGPTAGNMRRNPP
jgi:hypothetical protein